MFKDLVVRYIEYKDLLEVMDDEVQRLSSKLEKLRKPRIFESFHELEKWAREQDEVIEATETLRREIIRAEQIYNRAKSDLVNLIPYKSWVKVKELGLAVGNDNGIIVIEDIDTELPELGVNKGRVIVDGHELDGNTV